MARRTLDVSKVDIVFAEDEDMFRELALDVLSKAGFNDERIHVSEDGAGALADFIRLQAEGEPDCPVLVLLDMRMPGMDGLAAALKMQELLDRKAAARQTFMACCSANVVQACADEVSEGQPFRVTLTKPLTIKEVNMCLNHAADWWVRCSGAAGERFLVPVGGSTSVAPAEPAEVVFASEEEISAPKMSSSSGTAEISSIDIVIADSEPICRMAMMGQLCLCSSLIDPDKVLEGECLEEVEEHLQYLQQEEKVGDPLLLFLGDLSWYASISSMDFLRKPLFVFTSVDTEMMCAIEMRSSLFHTVLPTNYTQADLTKVLEECQNAFVHEYRR